MRKEEFMQQLKRDELIIGDDIWYTCIVFSPKSMSLSRHIKPIKVRISAWQENNPVGSGIYFRGFKTNGDIDYRQYYNFYNWIIPPAWDQRAEVFFTEAEAQEGYQRQLIPVKQHVQETWDARITKLENLKTRLILEPDKEAQL